LSRHMSLNGYDADRSPDCTQARRLRVLCVGRDFKPGGAEKLQLAVLEDLQRHADVDAFYLSDVGELRSMWPARVPLFCATRSGQSIRFRAAGILHELLLRARACDVIFAMQDATPAYLAQVAAFATKKPSVLWLHSIWPKAAEALSAWHQPTAKFFYTQFDRLISVSHVANCSLIDWLPQVSPRTSVVPNFLGDLTTNVLEASILPFRPSKLVLIASRLVASKRIPLAIDALKTLRKSRTDVEMVIIGDGPLCSQLQDQAAQCGLADVIHFLGFQADPYRFIRGTDVLCVPSANESFGMVALEAMALGTAVVACSDSDGVAELLGHGQFGEVVVPTPTALASGLDRAISGALEEKVRRAKGYAMTFRAHSPSLPFLKILESVASRTVPATP
jgi:glycosyltransferase involved in cell wall biosynthesis